MKLLSCKDTASKFAMSANTSSLPTVRLNIPYAFAEAFGGVLRLSYALRSGFCESVIQVQHKHTTMEIPIGFTLQVQKSIVNSVLATGRQVYLCEFTSSPCSLPLPSLLRRARQGDPWNGIRKIQLDS
jgi:hypothetical protein